MLKDFYFSATYDRLERNDFKNQYILKEVLINGKYEKYSFCVNTDNKFDAIWNDTIYVGTADDNCCVRNRK